MLTETIRESFMDLYTITGVPFTLRDRKGCEICFFPASLSGFTMGDGISLLIEALETCSHPDGVLLHPMGSNYYTATVRLENDIFLVTAPVSATLHQRGTSFPQIHGSIRPERLADFYRIILEVPCMNNYQLARMAGMAHRVYCGCDADGISIKYTAEAPVCDFNILDTEFSIENPAPARVQAHVSSSFEQDLAQIVKSGDQTRLEQLFSRPLTGYVGRMSMNDLRQCKYMFISCITLVSRAAAQGGLPMGEALDLSDRYCQEMDSMSGIAAIEKLTVNMAYDYCRRVALSQETSGYRRETRMCINYIKEHLYEPVTLAELSRLTYMCSRNLSLIFRKDTGVAIPDYIHSQRLMEAARLLNNPAMSPSQISSLLQYSSQSYFCRKFKAAYGMTPQEYREQLP